MSENGVARSRPPQHQLLGGGGVLLIGLACLWLGCRRWVTPSFSDDDAGVSTIWLAGALFPLPESDHEIPHQTKQSKSLFF